MKIKKYISLILLITFCFIIKTNSKEGFYIQGIKLFNQKNFNESKFKFEQEIVFNPKSEISYLYLAKIFKEKENDDLQEQNLKTVILLNPSNEEAIYLLALLSIKKSDYEETDRLIKKFEKVCKNKCNKKTELLAKLNSLKTK